jgi:hypothetical protein
VAYPAYLASIFLWIPLAVIAAMAPSARGRLVVPLAASALGALYQAVSGSGHGYGFVVVLFVLCAVDAISGLVLVFTGRAHPHRAVLRIAGALCLAIPAAVLVDFARAGQAMGELDRVSDLGRRVRFETAFRDDVTQKRIFGDLDSATSPWAGYYVSGGEDSRFKHLVINADGRYWLYHSELWDEEGKGGESASAPDTFEGQATGRSSSRRQLFLKRQPGGRFEVEVRDPHPEFHNKPVTFTKSAPPRFPAPPSPADTARFVGEFSATYDENEKSFWLVQVWLWESKGEWWGRYIRDNYARGQPREFISAEAIEPRCASECKVLSFTSSRGPVTLARISDDEFKAKLAGVREEVTLRRGEKLPGFIFDLAPLATPRKNREWIEAISLGRMLTWNVPEK